MDRNYCDKMGSLRLSPAGKRDLAETLTSPAQKPAPRPLRMLRIGPVAAVILCALALTASAAAVLVPVLQSYFGASADYVYQKNSQILNLSQTVDGWTMTLTDCIGDDRFLYVGIEVTAPRGTVLGGGGGSAGGLGAKDVEEGFLPAYTFDSYTITTEDGVERPMAWYINQVPDEDAADNHLRFVLWINCRQPLDGTLLTLEIGKLYTGIPYDGAETYAFDGKWRFENIPLDLSDQTIRLRPDTSVPVLDTTATLRELSVSPISVTVLFEGEGLIGQRERYPNGYNIADPTIVLYDKQGNVMPLESKYAPFGSRGGSGSDNENGALRIVQSYETFIDLDALGWVEVCSVRISVPENGGRA